MDLLEHLRRQLVYNAWGHQQTLKSLLAARTVPERAAAVMAHLVAAEWVWLRRLGNPAPPMEVWPALTLAECEGQLRDLSGVWRAYLGGQTPAALAREIRYTNSKGETWSSTVTDVLTHVVLHGSYHRGQIATLLGRAGERAAYTDYIEWTRRGYADGGWPT